ncbi:unnamed protein product, partial [Tenebrio molitor]
IKNNLSAILKPVHVCWMSVTTHLGFMVRSKRYIDRIHQSRSSRTGSYSVSSALFVKPLNKNKDSHSIVKYLHKKEVHFYAIFCVILAALLSPSTMAENTAELQVLQGNSAFTNNLYKVLAEKEGNVFFSPISVHVVLSMAYQGALDTTAEKFANTLHVPKAKAAAEGYNEIMKRLNSVTNVTLLMANKVFLMEGFQLLSDFENAVTKHFLSEVQLVDFKKNEEAAKTINSWVEVQTREKIKDLIQKDDLDGSTRLVLVNAIYFKGDWKHKFDKERTKTEPFYLNDKDTIDVQMMHIKKKFNYKNDSELQAQVIELPYTNEDLSMFIILPNEKNGIGNLEKKLATMNLTDISKNMWSTEVNLALPKFKIEETIDLKDALTKLGLGEIFDERKANFGGMIQVGSGNLYVSKVVQKAFIEVNEEGAEAAAATVACCARIDFNPNFFIADHPFIFLLVTKSPGTRNFLFVGKINKPASH